MSIPHILPTATWSSRQKRLWKLAIRAHNQVVMYVKPTFEAVAADASQRDL